MTFRLDHAISSKGDFSDVLFGFGGTAARILLPVILVMTWLLTRFAPPASANLLALQLLLFGIVYPCVAGLDAQRQSLYFDLLGLGIPGSRRLAIGATILRRLARSKGHSTPTNPQRAKVYEFNLSPALALRLSSRVGSRLFDAIGQKMDSLLGLYG